MDNLLHITNGESVIATLAEAGVPGSYTQWSDVLWEGPVLSTTNDDEFLAHRARFLHTSGYHTTFEEAFARLRSWDSDLKTFHSRVEVVRWFEHDLFDQLNLIRLLDWFSRQNLNGGGLSLICIGEYPGMPRFRGLGELRADQLAPLFSTRSSVTTAQLDLARGAWSAFTDSEPTGLERIISENTTALPFLAAALKRLLEEYPSTRNGLSRSEQQSMKAAAKFERAAAGHLFVAVQEMEESPFTGDASFWRVLAGLGKEPGRLLDIGSEDDRFHRRTVQATALGHSVLAGRDDFVNLRGIDRWIGGVRLHGSESPWRWNGHRLVAAI